MHVHLQKSFTYFRLAKKLEVHLYHSAPTKEDYVDSSSLKKRLQMIMCVVGVRKSSDSVSQATTSKAHSGHNSQFNHFPVSAALSQSPSSLSSPAPNRKTTDRRKVSWTQNEIKAFLSALRNITGFIDKKDVIEHISENVKTKNYNQCYDFPRNVKIRVEVSQTATPEENAIYNIFEKYDKDKFINNPTNNNSNDIVEGVDNNKFDSLLKDATTDNVDIGDTNAAMLSPSKNSRSPSSAPIADNDIEIISIATTNSNDSDYISDGHDDQSRV